MNLYDKELHALDLSAYRKEFCCYCGKPKTDGHHVVLRSAGGTDADVISLCSSCHADAHNHTLHFKASCGHLCAVKTKEPTSIDYAMLICGWDDLSRRQRAFERSWQCSA
jgi:hypothetical protein